MSQNPDIIDLRRSYIPIDPNALPNTLHNTSPEDNPEARIPVIPYIGYNFMPTPQGYCSFFGTRSVFSVPEFEGNVDDIFIIQTTTYENILVILSDDGIWTQKASTDNAWVHEVDLDIPVQHREWTKCVIDNVIYVYRQGEDVVWIASPTTSYNFVSQAITGVNMAGQLGIFKAGARLGFWDSENSIGWSSLVDTSAFGDADQLSGFTIFQDIVGRIVTVLQHGDGFIVYCTKSIVLVRRNPGSPMLFAGSSIFNNNGISYSREVCFADPDTVHYAGTSQGLVEIKGGQPEIISPEIWTYLKETRQPIYLKMLNGRYLHFQILDSTFIINDVSFRTEEYSGAGFTTPGSFISSVGGSYSWASIERNLERWLDGTLGNAGNVGSKLKFSIDGKMDQLYLYRTYGYTSYTQATIAGEVPIWKDNISTILDLEDVNAWKETGSTGFGSVTYFNDKFTDEGGIPRIDGGTEYMIPVGMMLAADYTEANLVEQDNTNNFYEVQEMAWLAEEKFAEDWNYSIRHRAHPTREIVGTQTLEYLPDLSDVTTSEEHSFGPYIDFGFFSEANRYYGVADKSAWLQRSLVRGIIIKTQERQTTRSSVQLATWVGGHNVDVVGVTLPTYQTLAEALGAQGVVSAAFQDNHPDFEVVGSSAEGTPVIVTFEIEFDGAPVGQAFFLPAGSSGLNLGDPIQEVYSVTPHTYQTFGLPRFEPIDFETCVYQELGFTKIEGHGHYDIEGAFVVDNSTPQVADYIDQCETPPAKKRRPVMGVGVINETTNQLGNTVVIDTAGFLGSPPTTDSGEIETITLGETTYTYPVDSTEFPAYSIQYPSGEIFLQDGSIEPLYPIFVGAFVFDMQYKKWGKANLTYKHFLDLFPINNIAGDNPIPYDTFLPRSAGFLSDGLIYPFDKYPLDSRITYGKYGVSRIGFTTIEELKIHHRGSVEGTILIEGSLDGINLEPGLSIIKPYTSNILQDVGIGLSARWFNITIEGNYDLVHLEARSTRGGKR